MPSNDSAIDANRFPAFGLLLFSTSTQIMPQRVPERLLRGLYRGGSECYPPQPSLDELSLSFVLCTRLL